MLNGELLRERRIAANLSIRTVAEHTGISAETLRALEAQRYTEDRQFTLASLERLTKLLDIDTGDLFAQPAPTSTDGPAGNQWHRNAIQDKDRDIAKLQAALLDHGGVLTRDDLADAFGWDLQRLEHALGALRDRLQPTGLRFRRASWNSYTLAAAPGALSSRERQQLHGATRARQPLATEPAAMLYEIMFGFQTADLQRALLAADPPALRQLQQLSLIRVVGRDRIEPHPGRVVQPRPSARRLTRRIDPRHHMSETTELSHNGMGGAGPATG